MLAEHKLYTANVLSFALQPVTVSNDSLVVAQQHQIHTHLCRSVQVSAIVVKGDYGCIRGLQTVDKQSPNQSALCLQWKICHCHCSLLLTLSHICSSVSSPLTTVVINMMYFIKKGETRQRIQKTSWSLSYIKPNRSKLGLLVN